MSPAVKPVVVPVTFTPGRPRTSPRLSVRIVIVRTVGPTGVKLGEATEYGPQPMELRARA